MKNKTALAKINGIHCCISAEEREALQSLKDTLNKMGKLGKSLAIMNEVDGGLRCCYERMKTIVLMSAEPFGRRTKANAFNYDRCNDFNFE